MSKKILPGAGESVSHQAPALHLPSVDRLLADAQLADLIKELGRERVKRAIHETLDELRLAIREGRPPPPGLSQQEGQASIAGLGPAAADGIIGQVQRKARAFAASRLRGVINLTGTVIHTNLGRALLADEAIDAVAKAMRSYAALEFDIASGERGDRDAVVEELLCRLTGAQAATVVNNCAAAVLLSLVALGARKEVIISRGEQIEIGGAFRMPDIMRAASCKLVEVGTTNRTHLRDYADAITDKTALIVKAHRSNYAVTGFTAEVGDEDLGKLAQERGIFYMVDLGSGALVDMSALGLPREPLPSDALSHGAHVVMFSGDKLLGGPQAGIIVGSKEAISKIKKHPLKRALRASKIVFAALEATLRIYDSQHEVTERLPVLAMLTRDRETIRKICERVAPALHAFAGNAFDVAIRDCASQIGSGALPEERLASSAVVLIPKERSKGTGRMLNATLKAFRELPLPVIGRISDDSIILDCRCLNPLDEAALLGQLPTP